MWKSLLFCVLLMVIGGLQQINCLQDNAMPVQSLLGEEENLKKITNEMEKLKLTNDILMGRFDVLQSRFEQQLVKLDTLGDGIKAEEPPRSLECSSSCFPSNCFEALIKHGQSGIHSIQVDRYGPNKFLVYCDVTTQGGGWTVIQRRLDGSIDFLRKWSEYKQGFGNLNGEFFIGLDKLHALTMDTPQELLIIMEDFDNVTKYAKYDSFAIGNESEGYALNVLGAYSGNAGDSLTYHASYKFSTIDRDNDIDSRNCAEVYKGAWWYKNCHQSNLNGLYLKGEYEKEKFAQGVNWKAWRGFYYSLKSVVMLIRPTRF